MAFRQEPATVRFAADSALEEAVSRRRNGRRTTEMRWSTRVGVIGSELRRIRLEGWRLCYSEGICGCGKPGLAGAAVGAAAGVAAGTAAASAYSSSCYYPPYYCYPPPYYQPPAG
jgi:hypothetical protein